ncbi:MAG: KDO2-lipid IV(A) lauroyltransferase [Saprospiraceae bacterium]|jgi:KDO2-lipid IV(A) lauroyltransferase
MVAPVQSDLTIKFQKAYFAPRYWPTWLFMGFVWLGSNLPRPIGNKLGDGLGWCFKKLNKKRRHIVVINLRLCFPQLSEQQRGVILDDHYRFYGRSVIDLGLSWWAPFKRLEKLIEFKGKTAYLDTLKQHNVIVVVPHFTGLDGAACFMTSFAPTISMMKAQKNELLNWRLWKGRTRHQPTRVIMREQGLRPLIKATKKGTACLYLPDEDFGDTSFTVFAPFFGHPNSTLTALSRMAKLSNAKVIPMFPKMLENGHYEVEFKPAIENFPSGDDLQDAIVLNKVIEEGVSAAPAQYLWTLQWFRSQPDNGPSPYFNN